MKIAIIGAGRRRNGIGPYIARYVHGEGARVVAVLAQDEDAARHDAEGLKEYGITADAYADLGVLIEQHQPDAIAIASPAATHAEYLSGAIAAGLHVLCEKPFIWNDGCDSRQALQILEAARTRNLIVAMNSQWPFVLPVYERICGLPAAEKIESFQIHLAPLSTGRDMIPDAMPHALSLLYSVLGPGFLEQLTLEPGPERLNISFFYVTDSGRCQVTAELARETCQPRSFAFGFNGKIARRTIDMATYRIAFTCGDKRCEVEDPLQQSVRDFLQACRDVVPPRIGSAHIVATMQMLQQVYAAWPAEPPV